MIRIWRKSSFTSASNRLSLSFFLSRPSLVDMDRQSTVNVLFLRKYGSSVPHPLQYPRFCIFGEGRRDTKLAREEKTWRIRKEESRKTFSKDQSRKQERRTRDRGSWVRNLHADGPFFFPPTNIFDVAEAVQGSKYETKDVHRNKSIHQSFASRWTHNDDSPKSRLLPICTTRRAPESDIFELTSVCHTNSEM